MTGRVARVRTIVPCITKCGVQQQCNTPETPWESRPRKARAHLVSASPCCYWCEMDGQCTELSHNSIMKAVLMATVLPHHLKTGTGISATQNRCRVSREAACRHCCCGHRTDAASAKEPVPQAAQHRPAPLATTLAALRRCFLYRGGGLLLLQLLQLFVLLGIQHPAKPPRGIPHLAASALARSRTPACGIDLRPRPRTPSAALPPKPRKRPRAGPRCAPGSP